MKHRTIFLISTFFFIPIFAGDITSITIQPDNRLINHLGPDKSSISPEVVNLSTKNMQSSGVGIHEENDILVSIQDFPEKSLRVKKLTCALNTWKTAAEQAKITEGLADSIINIDFTDCISSTAFNTANKLLLKILQNPCVRQINLDLEKLRVKDSKLLYVNLKTAIFIELFKEYSFSFPENIDPYDTLLLPVSKSMPFYTQYLACNRSLDPEKAKYPFIAHLLVNGFLYDKDTCVENN